MKMLIALVAIVLLMFGCRQEVQLAPTPTAEPAILEPESQAPDAELDAELEYLDAAIELLDEADAIMSDTIAWMDVVVAQYEAGRLFPDTSRGERALTRWQDYSARVEVLEAPVAYTETHRLWLRANDRMQSGLELYITGVEQANVTLMDQAVIQFDEGTRLINESTAAIPAIR